MIVRNLVAQLHQVNQAFGTGLVVVEQNVPATLKLVEHALILNGDERLSGQARANSSAKPDLWEWF